MSLVQVTQVYLVNHKILPVPAVGGIESEEGKGKDGVQKGGLATRFGHAIRTLEVRWLK